MTPSPPPDRRLGFDEFIAILVAFSTIGAILSWSLSHRNSKWNFSPVSTPLASPTAQATPLPSPTTAPLVPILPIPAVAPAEKVPSTKRQPSSTEQLPAFLDVPLAQTQPRQTFSDVPPSFWAYPFIEGLVAQGAIARREQTFRPNDPVTRAEFARWLQAAFKTELGQTSRNFKDVTRQIWAGSEIDTMAGAGFLKGYPGQVFRPEQPISKVQVLVSLASGLKLVLPPTSTQVVRIYRDAVEIPRYATDKVAAATQANLVVNYPEPQVLNPQKNATRAEVAAIAYQALVQAGKAPSVTSPYLVPSQK